MDQHYRCLKGFVTVILIITVGLLAAQVQQMQCASSDGSSASNCLPIDGHAWKVQFDRMGTLLATSAVDGDSSSVCVWELNPDGQWYLLSKIEGGALPSEDDAEQMPE